METVGKILRDARESLGFTLEEVERATHIRAIRLQALEDGEFDSFPSAAQLQGFLRNYADYLGLDPAHILDLYLQGDKAVVKGARGKAAPARPGGGIPAPPRARRFKIYGDQIITTGVGLAVIALVVWGTNRILFTLNQPEPEGNATVTEALPAPTVSPSSTAQLIGAVNPPSEATTEVEPTLTPTLPLGLVDRIELELLAEQSTFVEVYVDGREEYQGRMLAGEQRSFQGEDRVEVITGNARGLRVFFNGQDQGLMGQVNQVLTRIWTIRGMQTPTPTQTLTPTASPPATATFTPTRTPVQQPGG